MDMREMKDGGGVLTPTGVIASLEEMRASFEQDAGPCSWTAALQFAIDCVKAGQTPEDARQQIDKLTEANFSLINRMNELKTELQDALTAQETMEKKIAQYEKDFQSLKDRNVRALKAKQEHMGNLQAEIKLLEQDCNARSQEISRLKNVIVRMAEKI